MTLNRIRDQVWLSDQGGLIEIASLELPLKDRKGFCGMEGGCERDWRESSLEW